MEILTKLSKYPTGVVLILGFFDGVHLGHKAVISQAVTFAQKNNTKTVTGKTRTTRKLNANRLKIFLSTLRIFPSLFCDIA